MRLISGENRAARRRIVVDVVVSFHPPLHAVRLFLLLAGFYYASVVSGKRELGYLYWPDVS